MNNQLHVSNVLTSKGWLQNQTVTITNGIVTSIEDWDGDEVNHNELTGTLIPGYVDTQVNGGGGVLLNSDPTYRGLKSIANAHAQFGTVGMLPTLITDNLDVMEQAADAVSEAIADKHPTILGVHFEGPFLSVEKKGVHDQNHIRQLSERELSVLTRKDLGKVMITVAPENVSPDMIKHLVEHNVIVALGHSNADGETARLAIEAGATGFTHLFNAMSPLTSREPGMVGQALLTDAAFCGLIVDHHHLHPDSASLAIKVKGKDRIMLVTDAMAHVGTSVSEMRFFDTTISRVGSKLTTPNGTLAGSCLDMHRAVLNVHRDLHISLEDSVNMASATPAAFLKIDDTVGSIAPGQSASFVLLDEQLEIASVWLHGQPISNTIEQ